jgi:hypothetical protein
VAIAGLALGAAGRLVVGAAGHAASETCHGGQHTEAVLPDADAARPLPPLDQMDTFLRALLGTLSSSPELARWLTTDDLIRQMANGIDRIANGASPPASCLVLKPKGAFAASQRRNEITLDPAELSPLRPAGRVVSSLDAQAVAEAYRTIRPRLDEAYRHLAAAPRRGSIRPSPPRSTADRDAGTARSESVSCMAPVRRMRLPTRRSNASCRSRNC